MKVYLQEEKSPTLLRLYLRDKDAAYREKVLGELLKRALPLPEVLYIGDYDNIRFAITTFIEGRTLRDLLLSNLPYDIESLMIQVGKVLGKISQFTFPKSGDFGNNLNVKPPYFSEKLLIKHVEKCLQKIEINPHLSMETCAKIRFYFESFASLLPKKNETHLVHGDFDPANILVKQVNESWIITGILDWEFAFSGSSLWDVSNMLRYAHKMSSEFESAFLKGLQEENVSLPPHWREATYLLTLSSLIDLLSRTDPATSPLQYQDIKQLIELYLRYLDAYTLK
ncbi:MAG: aminoglycoside phosphotransferase family protein [Proteobacteria bacterium]|nr:aminoglycoside phosphotransferase family protein [Pseudomonadota bacterium]